jgi:hypothetical protein
MNCLCPECDARLKLGDDLPPGKQIQCPKCNKIFKVPARSSTPAAMPSVSRKTAPEENVAERDEPDDRPLPSRRRPRRKKKATNRTAIVLAVVGVAVLLSGTAVGVTWWRAKNKDTPVAQGQSPAAVNVPNLPVGREIGNLAPEIQGEDIDGRPFKLSDYRGKVVVLDFWGNW